MDVDIDELVETAKRLAALAHETGRATPDGWVLPAGTDPISAAAVPRLNTGAAALFNELTGVLGDIQRTAHRIGGAAVDYTVTDDEGGRTIGGGGREIVANPVPLPAPGVPRVPPPSALPASAAVDPLTFARGLHTGPGPGRAAEFARSVRTFATELQTGIAPGLATASRALHSWSPVGTAASTELHGQHGLLTRLGTRFEVLANGIDSYGAAFRAAKAKHPTPQEILATRTKLLAAMRSRDPLGTQAALAEFQEQNARSAETITGYSGTVGSEVAASEAAAAGGEQGSSGESGMLESMLPALMSAMTAADGLGGDEEYGYDDLGYDDYGYDDYGYEGLGIPSSAGLGAGPGGSPIGTVADTAATADPAMAVGGMPMMGATGTGSTVSGLPRTPVIEPLGSGSQAGANAARAGSPYMPYMPMAPGMGGQGGSGNDRNRVVAWHPDRLMYVDDTPHTDPVIGERPAIAPAVTPPTPAPPAPPSSGGTA